MPSVAVHYGGVACEMNTINEIARSQSLRVIEDAAQGILSFYRGRPLGSLSDLATISFHDTKNVVCGEGGALLVNAPELVDRASVLQDKGTNRREFLLGRTEKYEWVDVGSSFLLGELPAAFLAGQLGHAAAITDDRLQTWHRYHAMLQPLEAAERVRRPIVPAHAQHNAHLYYVLLPTAAVRGPVLAYLHERGIEAAFHYVPLHDSPAGRRHGRATGKMLHTGDLSARLVRLPLWSAMPEETIAEVVSTLERALDAVL